MYMHPLPCLPSFLLLLGAHRSVPIHLGVATPATRMPTDASHLLRHCAGPSHFFVRPGQYTMCEEVRGLELVVILLSSTKEGAGGGKRAQRPTHPYECATPTISDLTRAVEASRMFS